MAYTKEFSYTVQGEGHPITVDKSEYIHFRQMTGGSMMRPTFWVTFMFVIILGLNQMSRENPVYSLLAFLAMILLYLLSAGVALWVVKTRWSKEYDRQIESGVDYYGLVTVTPQQVEKCRNGGTVTVPLDSTSLVIEDDAIFVILNRHRQGIILPARFVTEEMAAILRQCPCYRPGKKRLIPGGATAEIPAAEQRQVAYDSDFVYTLDEMIAVRKAQVTDAYWQRAPLMALLSFLMATTGLTADSNPVVFGVAVFLVTFGVLSLLNWWVPRRQTDKLAAMGIPEEARHCHMTVDSRGVRLSVGSFVSGLPWSAIRHVYDGELIRFETRQGTAYLPRRCVVNIQEFSADMDEFRKQ